MTQPKSESLKTKDLILTPNINYHSLIFVCGSSLRSKAWELLCGIYVVVGCFSGESPSPTAAEPGVWWPKAGGGKGVLLQERERERREQANRMPLFFIYFFSSGTSSWLDGACPHCRQVFLSYSTDSHVNLIWKHAHRNTQKQYFISHLDIPQSSQVDI